jgi:hypothetical protein
MKQFIQTWRFGMELLLRLVVMLFCVTAGPALSLVAHFGLVAFGVQVPPPTVVIAQLVSAIVVGPLLLVGYADYCGYQSRTSHPESSH